MTDHSHPTRRNVLRAGAALGATALGLTAVGSAAAKSENARTFGRVYANGELWRTNVVRVFDERPDPEDALYFLHDGSQPIVARNDVSDRQASPFVSESAPGDREWNGGKWVTYSAKVTDVAAFNAAVPVADATTLLTADFVEVTLGNPGFGPPDFFLCPLNGPA